MKTEKIYDQWKRQRRDIQPPENFSTRVMEKINSPAAADEQSCSGGQAVEPAAAASVIRRVFEAAAAIGLSAFGLFRATYQMMVILTP